MGKCVNTNHPEFKALQEQTGLSTALLAAKVAIWQEKRNSDIFPNIKEILGERFVLPAPLFALSNATKDEENQIYKGDDGKEYGTVTNEFMPAMQHKPFTMTDTFGTRQADQFWKDGDRTEQKKFANFANPVDYETYKNLIDEKYEMARYKGVIFHKIISNFITGSNSGLSELFAISGIEQREFQWMDADTIKRIINRTGTNAYNDNPSLRTDKLITEPAIVSDIMGVGGTPDLVIDHGGEVYSVFDLKTGKNFDRNFELDFFKYGRAGEADIFVNPRNKAKLQIMLYAMMIRLNNPKARFRNLEVVHVTSRYGIDDIDSARFINVPAYLHMIKSYLKAERPGVYEKMIAADKNVFDVATYNHVSSNKYGNKEASEVLKLKQLELQALVMYDTNLRKTISSGKYAGKDRQEQIAKLVEEINELRKDPHMDLKSWDTDMGWMDRWLGSSTASTNPYVKLYYSMVSDRKQMARTAYGKWRGQFDKVLSDLMQERTGKPISRLVGGVDRTELFQWAYKPGENRLFTSKDVEYNNFTKAQKNFIDFVNTSIGQFFIDKLANYENIANPTTALANRTITFTERANRKINVSNLDLFNGKYSNNSRPEFKYYEGFFPKFPPQLYDIKRQYGLFSPEMRKFIYNRNFTHYYEMVFDRWNASREAIPMKYLDNDSVVDTGSYTMNLELSVDSFVKQYFYKLYLDEAYSYGLGLKVSLDYLEAEGGDKKDRLKKYLEDSVQLHILGKKSMDLDFSNRSFGKVTEQGYLQFSGVKFLRSVKSYFSGVTMWVKPVSGTVNAVFANLVTLKEGLRNSLGKGENVTYTVNDLRQGYAIASEMLVKDAATGNLRNNKAWLLMEKFGYLPDNVDWYTSKNELLTANNKLFTSKTLTLFHSLPEEALATAMFVAQLKAMKTVDKNGNTISMWDAYSVENGDVEYIGGSRGVRNISNFSDKPEYKEVFGLEIEEANAIKFLYEKIHGGYRADERVAAEYYVLGEMMMQLKRYLPSILKNVWASRGTRATEGFFKKEVDVNGKEVLKWHSSIIEGRWRMLIGLLFNRLAIQNSKPGDKGNKIREFFGLQFDESYDWDTLSEQQKEDLKDFAITGALYLMMIIAGKSLWDDDDKDTTKKIFYRITDDFGSYVSPVEIVKNAINLSQPVSAKKSIQLLDSSSKFLWSTLFYTGGMDDKALTKDGNFRGAKDLQRNIPFISAYHDLFTAMENDSYFEQFLR